METEQQAKQYKTPIYMRKAQKAYELRLKSQGLYDLKNREKQKTYYYKKKMEKEGIFWLMNIDF